MSNTNSGLTKQEKIALVRDVMIRMPDYKRYGYNRKIIDLIRKQTGITLIDNDITRCIDAIEKQWQEGETIKYSKEKIIEMFAGLYESKDAKPNDKRMVLQEIGKLEGHYTPDISINNFSNMDPENVKMLEGIFGKRDNKDKEEKG